MAIDILALTGRTWRNVAIDWWMDDRVIDERHALLAHPVPAPSVALVGRVDLTVGTQRPKERGLVVRRATQPAIGDARPLGDCIAARHLLLQVGRRLEIAVREAAPLGRCGEEVLAALVVCVQGV